jgi:acyl-CoA thioesterase-1
MAGTRLRLTPSARAAAALAALVVSAAWSAACGSSSPATSRTAAGATAARPAAAAPAAVGGSSGAASGVFKIAFLGDSITAAYGLLSEQGYPGLIGKQFAADGYSEVEVVSNGITGDTTAGGLRRLDDVLEPGVRILVVALGGNDALRGLSPMQSKDNLVRIIKNAQAKDVQVVLVGMLAPPNLGPDYRDAFSNMFISLSREYKSSIVYIPFLLEGVAGDPALNQADGVHPTAEGQKIIADHLYPPLRNLVDAMQ